MVFPIVSVMKEVWILLIISLLENICWWQVWMWIYGKAAPGVPALKQKGLQTKILTIFPVPCNMRKTVSLRGLNRPCVLSVLREMSTILTTIVILLTCREEWMVHRNSVATSVSLLSGRLGSVGICTTSRSWKKFPGSICWSYVFLSELPVPSISMHIRQFRLTVISWMINIMRGTGVLWLPWEILTWNGSKNGIIISVWMWSCGITALRSEGISISLRPMTWFRPWLYRQPTVLQLTLKISVLWKILVMNCVWVLMCSGKTRWAGRFRWQVYIIRIKLWRFRKLCWMLRMQ